MRQGRTGTEMKEVLEDEEHLRCFRLTGAWSRCGWVASTRMELKRVVDCVREMRWIVRPSEGQMRVEGRQVTSGSDAEVREAANSRMRMSTLRV